MGLETVQFLSMISPFLSVYIGLSDPNTDYNYRAIQTKYRDVAIRQFSAKFAVIRFVFKHSIVPLSDSDVVDNDTGNNIIYVAS